MNLYEKIGPVLFLASAMVFRPAVAAASDWEIDSAKSSLAFSGTQTGAKFSGKFSRYNAVIAFDPDHLDLAHILVTVDLASAGTGDTQRDSALPGSDWFSASKYPQAKFEADKILKTGPNSFQAVGTLSLRGVTKPLVLPFEFQLDGNEGHAKGHASLNRAAFGVGQGAFSTGQWVGLDVGIDIDIFARRSSQADRSERGRT